MLLSIGEVANRAGLKPSALRYYEQIGLLPKPDRIGGKRRYTDEIGGRLEIIKLAQNAGFQMQEIKMMLEGFDSNVPPSKRWSVMAVKKQEEIQKKINQLNIMQTLLHTSLQCDCLSWEQCFQTIELQKKN